MPTASTPARTALAGKIGEVFDTIDLLDGASVLATVPLVWDAASGGAVGEDPDSVLADAGGDVDGATLYQAADPTINLTGLSVSTIAAGTGQVRLTSLTLVEDQPVDFGSVQLTVPTDPTA